MSSTLLPDRFSTGDFASWLRHFERCASANTWDDAAKLIKLPAFLQGPAASYFDSFTAEEKSTYAKLTESLLHSFSPTAEREQFYSQFDEQTLRPGEDPALFQWRLKELLERAEPDLSDTAKDALLRRQFMKGLPQNIRLRLLESNATPTLADMLSFSQRFRALHGEASRGAACATLATHPESGDTTKSLQQQQQQLEEQQRKMAGLEDMIRKLSVGQDNIIAAISHTSAAAPRNNGRRDNSPKRSAVRCFRCQNEGHIARNCPQRNEPKCGLCSGWGHYSKDCANNYSLSSSHSKLPLNFQGVPR